jgi:3-oxoacyl-[acyl-carrier-protein] synthase II
MKAWIRSNGIISPQLTYSASAFPETVTGIFTDRLSCIEPDYRELINPVLLRRMPRIIKMGLASARLCIDRAGGVIPGGIIVGTGLGCLDNLEKFLVEMLQKDEKITTVLPFINSTHNAVAAQVSMLLKNQSYSTTYSHRGFSFESALLDALMLLNERKALNVMAGGIDECTSDFHRLHSYLAAWKKPLNNLDLLSANTEGSISGEGSAFFMLTSEKGIGNVSVDGVRFFLSAENADPVEVLEEGRSFLLENGFLPGDIDVFMPGLNGDSRTDGIYHLVYERLFAGKPVACWKHLCGEYYTSTAFAFWLASEILDSQRIPETAMINKKKTGLLRSILIYNRTGKKEHSFILLTRNTL